MAEQLQTDIIIQAVNQASAQIKEVQNSLAGLQSQAAKATPQISGLNDAISSMGATLGKIGAGLTIGLTVPLVALGKAMIDQVGQLEQYKVAFDTMLGSAQKGSQVLKQLSDFAVKTPFTLTSVTESGKQLLAMGIAADKLIPTLKSLGDVSAGTGADLQRLVLNFGQVATQGKLTGRELRDFAVNGVPLVGELAKILGKSKDQIQEMVSAGQIGFPIVEQAFASMTSKGGQFFDLMDKQSKTFKGVLSNLQDQFTRVSAALLGLKLDGDQFGEVIKGGVFDLLKQGAQGALDAVTSLLEVFNGMSESTKKTIVAVGVFLATLGPLALAIAGVTAAIGVLTTATGGIFAILSATVVLFIALRDSGLAPLAVAAGVAIAAFIGINAAMKAMAAQALSTATAVGVLEAALGPVGLAAIAIGALIGVVALGVQENIKYKKSVDALNESLANFGKNSVEASKASAKFQADLKKIDELKNATLLEQAQAGGKSFIGQTVEDLKTLLASYGETGDASKKFIESLGNLSTGFAPTSEELTKISEHLKNLQETFDANQTEFNKLVTSYQAGGKDLTSATELAVTTMKNNWEKAGKDFGNLGESFRESVVTQVATTKGAAEAIVQAYELGLTSDQAKLAVSNAGIELNRHMVGTLIAEGAKKGGTKGAGEVNAGLFILGFDQKQRDAIIHSGNMVEAVRKALLSKGADVFNAGNNIGQNVISGIIGGIQKKIPALAATLGGVFNALGKAGGVDLGKFVQSADKAVATLISLGKQSDVVSGFNDGMASAAKSVEGLGSGAESTGKKLKDLKKDFKDAQDEFLNKAGGVTNDIFNKLQGGLSFSAATIKDPTELFKNLGAVLDDMKTKINDLISEHQKFIDGIKKGIDEYASKLIEVNKKYDDMTKKLAESTSSDVGKLLTSSLDEQLKLTKDLAEAQKDLNRATSQEQRSDLTTKIADLQKQLADKNALIEKTKKFAGPETATPEAEVKAAEAALVARGKELVLQDKSGALAKEYAEFQAKQHLDEIDFLLYKAGLEAKIIEEKKKQEIQNLNDAKFIQEQILKLDEAKTKKQKEAILATLTPEALGAKGVSDENIKLAQDAVAKETIYKASLDVQLKALRDFTDSEVKLYQDTNGLIGSSQKDLEGVLTTSYNNLIAHLNLVQEAAQKALIAQQALIKSPGGATPLVGGMLGGFFESGGYTGEGASNQVAGVVHRGEWVAPKWMVKGMSPIFGMLEGMRQGKGFGAKKGGDTIYKQPINIQASLGGSADISTLGRQLAWHLRTS